MRLESKVFVTRTAEQVWSYLGDIHNVPHWDRGVAQVRPITTSPESGLEFETIAHQKREDGQEWGNMSYRVAEVDPATGRCTVQLTSSTGNARFFKTAEWQWRVEPAAGGAWVICAAQFTLRFPYSIFAFVFYLMKSAISSDLQYLKHALESK